MTKNDLNPLEAKIRSFCSYFGPYVLFTAFFLILIEVFSLVFLTVYAELKVNDGRNPIQYSNQTLSKLYPDMNTESVRLMLKELWLQRPPQYDPLVEYSEAPYSGRFVNVAPAGYRKIAGQLPLRQPDTTNIFVFGGSTTFGYGVPDWETIPSYLQEKLNELRPDANFAVYNFGVGYYYSTLERIRYAKLLTNNLVPDIVIFIDGLNDFSFYYLPDKSSQSDFLGHLFKSSRLRLLLESSNAYSLSEKIFRRLFSPITRTSATSAEIKAAANRLLTNWKILEQISRSFGVKTIFVMQPLAFAEKENNPVAFDEMFSKQVAQVQADIQLGYEQVLKKKEKGELKSQNILWLDDFSIPGNKFVDYVHYNSRFSKAIAEKIALFILANHKADKSIS